MILLQRVVLDRSIGKLGLSVVGGSDHVSRVFGQGRPGVYVSKVIISSIHTWVHTGEPLDGGGGLY